MNVTEKTVALILGGGVGSRLYPLTKSRSKPAVPIVGKYRLIDIPISNCINSNIRRMFVLTMFNSASLNKHIKNTYQFDMFSEGFVDIMAAQQTPDNKDWFQGTADAVRKTLPRLEDIEHDYVLILSGDQLYNMDFEKILEYHESQGADVTVATIPVIAKDATGFGVMKVNKEGWIENFVEKPSIEEVTKWKSELPKKYTDENKDYLASMGIYVFSKEILHQFFEEQKDATDFGKEIIPNAVQDPRFKTASFSYDGYWADIGSIGSFLEANLKLTEYLPSFHLYDNNRKIYSRARMLAPTKIFGTRITHGLISDGGICHAAEISSAIIGFRSRIGSGTIVKDSIVMGNDYYQTLDDIEMMPDNELLGIGNDCYLERVIVDKNARVGHNVTIIGNDSLEDIETDSYCIREGIVIVKKGAHIAKGSKIGAIQN